MRDPNGFGAARWWRVFVALMIAAGGLGVAACGSSAKPKSDASSSYSQDVRYADCMRSHGVANFPDPAPGGGFPLRTSNVNLASPAFGSAQKACAKLQPGGSTPPRITGEQPYQMAAKARCIREHGFPDFPDPAFASGGGGMVAPADWNPEAPASIKARKACADVGIAIPGWGAAWFGPVG